MTSWPDRLKKPPERLAGVEMDAVMAKDEIFEAETRYWNSIIDGYVRAFHWKTLQLRNIMDMRAGFGGYESICIVFFYWIWKSSVNPCLSFCS